MHDGTRFDSCLDLRIIASPASKPTSTAAAGQQHVNSKWRFVPISFLLCFDVY